MIVTVLRFFVHMTFRLERLSNNLTELQKVMSVLKETVG